MKWMQALLLVATLSLNLNAAAQAPEWPAKPVRFVVPWPAGGLNDLIARAFNDRVGQSMGQPVVTDFKAGAAGRIGVAEIARTTPDGYTIGMGNLGPLTIHPTLYKQMPFDVKRDLVPVTMFAASPLVFVVSANAPFKTLAEFVNAARAQPGKYNYASVGLGSPQHLTFELVQGSAGVQLEHIPSKGTTEFLPSLIAGEVHASIDTLPLLLPHIQSGKLRALAVTAGARVPQLPDVPTLQELSLLDEPVLSWYALIVPARTPKPIIDKLYREYSAAAQTPEIKRLLNEQGLVYVPTTPEAFKASVERETQRWAKIIRDNRIEVAQ